MKILLQVKTLIWYSQYNSVCKNEFTSKWIVPSFFYISVTTITALSHLDYGHTDCVLTLLNAGSQVDCQDVSGATPLHYAINAGSRDDDVMIKHLLKFGASTSLADRNGRLPLHWAANNGR